MTKLFILSFMVDAFAKVFPYNSDLSVRIKDVKHEEHQTSIYFC